MSALPARSRNSSPDFDAWIDGDDIVMCTEAPGVDPDNDILIEVTSHGLRIFGSAQPTMPAHVTPMVRRRQNLAFNRNFKLSRPVPPDQVQAFYRDGLLHVIARGAAIPLTDEERAELTALHEQALAAAEGGSMHPEEADGEYTYGEQVHPRVINMPTDTD